MDPSNKEIVKKINFEIINDKYIFIKNYDHFGDDIKNVNATSITIEQLMEICNNEENIICFNNLGYLKHNININSLMCFNDDKKGLFVNIKRFEKKYNIKL
jgi:hypothetical protein